MEVGWYKEPDSCGMTLRIVRAAPAAALCNFAMVFMFFFFSFFFFFFFFFGAFYFTFYPARARIGVKQNKYTYKSFYILKLQTGIYM